MSNRKEGKSYSILKKDDTRDGKGKGGRSSESRGMKKNERNIGNTDYGIIVSIKPNFGFIQPFKMEEQLYFSPREFYETIKVGDKVGYNLINGARGYAAERLTPLASDFDKTIENLQGVITRGAEFHRSNYGLIEIDWSKLTPEQEKSLPSTAEKEVLFRQSDIDNTSLSKGQRLEKGDGVQFTVCVVKKTNLMVAVKIRFFQSKRDRQIAMQIERMVAAGASKEQGLVSALKKSEYGFIKALDRKDEVYFKVDDVSEDCREAISEGKEVSFFVMAESIKGKMSDRAVFIEIIPKGSVKFEICIGTSITAVVTEETGTYPEETPGSARLANPINITGIPAFDSLKKINQEGEGESMVDRIELWQRCLPTDLTCQIGDRLSLDVHYYRPEKLFFARKVKVKGYRKLGRESGIICGLKKEHGFGFIRSASRNTDIYFKTGQIVSSTGGMLSEDAVSIGLAVSFEAVADDSSSFGGNNSGGSSGVKLRAKRVAVEDEAAKKNDGISEVLMNDVLGLVVRNSTKKENSGIIKIANPEQLKTSQDLEIFDPEIISSLAEFQSVPELKEVKLFGLPTTLARLYYSAIEGKFPGLAHETGFINQSDPGAGKYLKVFKIEEAKDYTDWLIKNSKMNYNVVTSKESLAVNLKTTKIISENNNQSDGGNVSFFYEDYISQEFGPLANGMTVLFDLFFDTQKSKKVAKSIRLTNEPASDTTGVQFGVVDVVVERQGKFGFIRVFPSDEKLFVYASNSCQIDMNELQVGREVSFQIWRRGGVRCAIDLKILPSGSLSKDTILSGKGSGIVVSDANKKLSVVPVDLSGIEDLEKKYIPLPVMKSLFDSEGEGKNANEVKNEGVLIPENKPKYLNSLPRVNIPINLGEKMNEKIVEGSYISFNLSVNWVKQRNPLFCHNLELVPNLPKVKQRRGVIVRSKFRVKATIDPVLLNIYSIATTDFTEILDSGPSDGVKKEDPFFEKASFYCDNKEIITPTQPSVEDSYGRDIPAGAQKGDEVLYWVIPSLGHIAFHVTLVPKVLDGGISFAKRPEINAALKESEVARPQIIMAKGPPNDQSKGFEEGWRQHMSTENVAEENFKISTLPWAHLLDTDTASNNNVER